MAFHLMQQHFVPALCKPSWAVRKSETLWGMACILRNRYARAMPVFSRVQSLMNVSKSYSDSCIHPSWCTLYIAYRLCRESLAVLARREESGMIDGAGLSWRVECLGFCLRLLTLGLGCPTPLHATLCYKRDCMHKYGSPGCPVCAPEDWQQFIIDTM